MTHSQTCNLHKEPADSTQKSHKLQLLAWNNICMLEPVYLPDGTNGCRVHYDNGTFEDISCRLNLVLDTWAKEELTSVELAKELSRAWLASRVKLRLPLPFHPDLCLAPVKCRRRQRHNDCASGYVVLHKVRTVNIKAGGGSYIYFNGRPRPVPVLESRRSILENLAYGRMVAEAYRKAHVRAVSETFHMLY